MFNILAFTKAKQPDGNFAWRVCGTVKVCRLPIKGEFINIPNSQLDEWVIKDKDAGSMFFEIAGVIHSGDESTTYPAEIYLFQISHLQALNLIG